MPECEVKTRDSNEVELSFAEEECLRQLPTNPQWFKTEPNSFSDFGGEIAKTTRSFINPSRQRRKGRKTGETASGGFNTDFTRTSLNRLLQGFMFADARELPTTKSILRPAGQDDVTAVTGATGYAVTTVAPFATGMLVYASGFGFAANNGLKLITAANAVAGGYTVNVTPAAVNEPAPPSDAALEVCGFQFGAGLVSLAVTGDIVSLVGSGAVDFTNRLNLIPGAWVFIGGDQPNTRFDNNSGYARIKTVTAQIIVFDDVTFTPVTEAGAGKSIRLFLGTIIRNEKNPDLIKMRSYQLERTLGKGENGVQAEYLEGAVANEFSLELPAEEKIAADLNFLACRRTFRTGNVGDLIKTGDRIEASGEEVYNTTSDVYRMKIAVSNPLSSTLPPLVGYVQEGSIAITNNASPNTAIGTMGAIDFQFGDFEVSGSLTAYFADIGSVKSINDDSDCAFNVIGAYSNYGFVFDMPLLTLSGGTLNVEKDAPITLPIEKQAVEGEGGFTLLYQFFPYLPDLAMPE